MTANAQQEENLTRSQKIKKRLTEVWNLLEPYRLGFGLGALAVAATIVLVLTGQKSEKLNYAAKPANSTTSYEVVATPKEAGTSSSPQTLGASDSAQPAAGSSRLGSNNNTSSSSKQSASRSSVSVKVNINTANVSQLDTLPQIGPVTAKAIIDYRNAHGPFKSVEGLDNVKGIGPKTIEKIRNLVSVE